MEPETPAAPAESDVIRLAREAMDMTALAAAEASRAHDGKGVSVTYWRDVERGYGGRRGQRVAVRASARALAAMARVVGVRPAQLTAAGREDAARVLEEILRREATPPVPPAVTVPVIDDAARPEDIAPFVDEIRHLIAAAVIKHGAEPSGVQIFGESQEAATWDYSGLKPEVLVKMLATFRWFSFKARNAEQGGSKAGLDRLHVLPSG